MELDRYMKHRDDVTDLQQDMWALVIVTYDWKCNFREIIILLYLFDLLTQTAFSGYHIHWKLSDKQVCPTVCFLCCKISSLCFWPGFWIKNYTFLESSSVFFQQLLAYFRYQRLCWFGGYKTFEACNTTRPAHWSPCSWVYLLCSSVRSCRPPILVPVPLSEGSHHVLMLWAAADPWRSRPPTTAFHPAPSSPFSCWWSISNHSHLIDCVDFPLKLLAVQSRCRYMMTLSTLFSTALQVNLREPIHSCWTSSDLFRHPRGTADHVDWGLNFSSAPPARTVPLWVWGMEEKHNRLGLSSAKFGISCDCFCFNELV